jgi:quercetin dioxygenase-like cupin family protein
VTASEEDFPQPGVRRHSHDTAKATVASYAFEPGARFPKHRHDEEQVTIVLEGQVDFFVDGWEHRLGPGETFVVEAGVEHSLRAGEQGARFLAVVVPRRPDPDAYAVTP